MDTLAPITSFKNEYEFLSNFFRCPFKLYLPNGVEAYTVEHLFQAAKTDDLNWQRQIANAATPGMAKRLGRQVPLRKDWESIKIAVMQDLLQQKFMYEQPMKQMLIATRGHKLIEGNNWDDKFWGMVRQPDGEWVGQNHLGRLLMKIRNELCMQVDFKESKLRYERAVIMLHNAVKDGNKATVEQWREYDEAYDCFVKLAVATYQ